MLKNLLPKKNTNGGANDIRLEVPVPDYIPYACHYNPDTMLTKNGELIQVIKITGFYNERIGGKRIDLREIIKEAVLSNVKTADFSLWFHTIRRKQSLNPGGEFYAGFARSLNKAWKERNDWESQYVNEVYVSVIRDGTSMNILHPKGILSSLFFPKLKSSHDNSLRLACDELTKAVGGMLETLRPFGAKKLTIIEAKDGFYSEQLQFFAKILNLSEEPIPVPIRDLSECLATSNIAFGFNTMEVQGRNGKHFGAMFTIKESREIPVNVLDRFLQLPQEFIITQTLDFINGKQALKEFKTQHYILNVSGATDFAEDIGLNELVNSDKGSPTDFGEGQATIFLINNNLSGLEKDVNTAMEALKTLGIIATRRDLRMEECFWAQLPANFSNISRRKAINTKRVMSLAALYNFPAGKISGNLWGPAVTAFRTAGGTPYFFNFHKEDNGHTVLIGPDGSGKTALMNFLVSESRKFHGKLFFFDQLRTSKVFITALGGDYNIIKPLDKNSKKMFNPFHMKDTPRNRAFLKRWIIYVAEASGMLTSEQERLHLSKLVDYVCGLPLEQKRLSSMAGHFGGEGILSLEKKMAPWHSGGEYSHLFDNEGEDITSFAGDIYGFGMSFVLEDQIAHNAVLSYLLYRIEEVLDGVPTTIVLDEAWRLVNNSVFGMEMASWLDRLKEKNAMVIFASENIGNTSTSELTNQIADKITTQIFMPDLNAEESNKTYCDIWGLSEDEFKTLAAMNKDKRHFMLRQGDVSIVASLDLSGMKELDVLSGNDKTVKIMEEVITMVGDNCEDWLPVFYERMVETRGALESEKLFIV
jgi:type IV secretion system protein VirB4